MLKVGFKMGLKEEIKENQIVVVVTSQPDYSEKLLEIIRHVAQDYKKICYITLNKPYDTIIAMLKKKDVNTNKFFFIDAITKTVRAPKEINQCTYIESPRSLTALNIVMNQVLETANVDLILFDSINTLLVYEKPMVVTKFLHAVMSKIRAYNTKGVFVGQKGNATKVLLKDLNMFADKIIELDEGKEE